MLQNHPLAYISKSLRPKWQRFSVYEKELLAIVTTVQKWGSTRLEIILLSEMTREA